MFPADAVEDDLMRPLIRVGHSLHDFKSPICGAVVRENDLQRRVGLRKGALDCVFNIFLLVIGEESECDERTVLIGSGDAIVHC